MEEMFIPILAEIVYFTGLGLGLLFVIYVIIYEIKTSHLRKKHLQTLNEHDKSVIATYKSIHFELFKRKENK